MGCVADLHGGQKISAACATEWFVSGFRAHAVQRTTAIDGYSPGLVISEVEGTHETEGRYAARSEYADTHSRGLACKKFALAGLTYAHLAFG
jgi:hypothetical protein